MPGYLDQYGNRQAYPPIADPYGGAQTQGSVPNPGAKPQQSGWQWDPQSGAYFNPATGEHSSFGDLAGLVSYGENPLRTNRVTDVSSGGGGSTGNAQQAFMAQQGIQNNLDNKAMAATQQLLGNPWMHFGQGGGDWASQWGSATAPRGSLFDAIIEQQANSALGYGNTLNSLYNSPTGPYGQMQAAAAYTAPARSQRYVADRDVDIADRKYDTLRSMFNNLSNAIKTPRVSDVSTDYGAFAKIAPAMLSKYMPR